MKGLAVKLTNGNTTLYTNTDHVFVGGTNHLCLRTGNAATDVVSYPLTTNTSASRYSPIRVKINGSNCYLASQGQTQDVKYTLPQAQIIGYTPGQLELNSFTYSYLASYSKSRYQETNSIRRGTFINSVETTWEGRYSLTQIAGAGNEVGYQIIERIYQSNELPTNDAYVWAGYNTIESESFSYPPDYEEYWTTITVSSTRPQIWDEDGTDPLPPGDYYIGGNEWVYSYFTLNEFTTSDHYLTKPGNYQNINSGMTTSVYTSDYYTTVSTAPYAYENLFSYYSGTTAIGKRYFTEKTPINWLNNPPSNYLYFPYERLATNQSIKITTSQRANGDQIVVTSEFPSGGTVLKYNFRPTPARLQQDNVLGFFFSKPSYYDRYALNFRTTFEFTATYTYLRPEIQNHQYNDTRPICETFEFIDGYLEAREIFQHRKTNEYVTSRDYAQHGNLKYQHIQRGNGISFTRSISVSRNTLSVSTFYGKVLAGDTPVYTWEEDALVGVARDDPWNPAPGGRYYSALITVPVGGGTQDVYVPYVYTKYTNQVEKDVAVYSLGESHNYSQTRKYQLYVPEIGYYTSSLPYNTYGVTYESSAPVLYNQQVTNVITRTSEGYYNRYSTDVLVPYLATVVNQKLSPEYLTRQTIEYETRFTNTYTNQNQLEPDMTLLNLEYENVWAYNVPTQGYQPARYDNAVITKGTITSIYGWTDSVYSNGPINARGSDPTNFFNLNQYTYYTKNRGDANGYINSALNNYYSDGAYRARGVFISLARAVTNGAVNQTIVYETGYDTYTSHQKKNNTDEDLGYYDVQKVNLGKVYPVGSGATWKDAFTKANLSISATATTNSEWVKVSNDRTTINTYSYSSVYGSAELQTKYGATNPPRWYSQTSAGNTGPSGYQVAYTWTIANQKSGTNAYTSRTTWSITRGWTAKPQVTNSNSTASTSSTSHERYSLYTTTQYEAAWIQGTANTLSRGYYVATLRLSRTSSSYVITQGTTWSARISGTGQSYSERRRSRFRSKTQQQHRENYNSSKSAYTLSYQNSSADYYYDTVTDTYSENTIANIKWTKAEDIYSTKSEYTLRFSQVDELRKNSYLSTYTTAHTYHIDVLSNNANV